MNRLTAAGCLQRRQRLLSKLGGSVDYVLVRNPCHLMYLANYAASPFVFRSANSGAVLVIEPDGKSTLIADNLVEGFAKEAHVDNLVCPRWYRGQESAPQREAFLLENVIAELSRRHSTKVGLEMSYVMAGVTEQLRQTAPGVQWLNIDPHLHALRRQKDPDELALLQRCMDAGSAAHRAAWEQTRPGMTEMEVYLLIHDTAVKAAGEQVQVYGDFVSGPRCEAGGGPATQRVIEKGDLVLLDFSVVIAGYRGDFANTFRCGLAPSAEQKNWAQACLTAIRAAEAVAKPGVPAKELDVAVKASFAAQGLGGNFRSHTGHGLGLGHPDAPYLTAESSDVLMEGDVLAIEPSQMIPGQAGMRFEHNYVLRATGLETMSSHPLEIAQPGF